MPINEQTGGLLARTGAPMGAGTNVGADVGMPGPTPGQEPLPAGQEQVSGEEQDQYDRVVMAGMKVMFENETTRNQIADRLKADKEHPAKSLADTASMLMIQLDQQTDGNIPETVILPAAVELLEQLSDFADSLDIFPIDEAVMNHAGQLMVTSLGEQYGVEPEDIQALMDSTSPEQLKQIEEEQGNFARKQPPMPTGTV